MLKGFRYLLNIPAHIKKLYMNWKIKKFKKKNKIPPLAILLNILLGVLILSVLIYLYYIYRYEIRYLFIRNTGTVLTIGGVILVVAAAIIAKYKIDKDKKIDYSQISKIILKDEDGKNIRSWNIHDTTSLLIGKQSSTNDIDIDLSDSTYAKLISREHGVINYTGDNWYYEDIGSENGSGIKRKGEMQKHRIESDNPCLLNSGDTIYIANTKLLLQ